MPIKKIAPISITTALLLLLTGCASPEQGQDLSNLPEPKNATEAAQRVVAYAAGFCKGMAEKHGADFETCFKQQTDLAMAKIEADAASRATQTEASPVVLSKNGHEVMYIKRTYPGSEGMTPQQIEWSKAFGTYEDLQKSVAVDQGSVWVGTVVTLADGKCTESTSSIAEIPKVPGEPKMKVVNELIPCPTAQAN